MDLSVVQNTLLYCVLRPFFAAPTVLFLLAIVKCFRAKGDCADDPGAEDHLAWGSRSDPDDDKVTAGLSFERRSRTPSCWLPYPMCCKNLGRAVHLGSGTLRQEASLQGVAGADRRGNARSCARSCGT